MDTNRYPPTFIFGLRKGKAPAAEGLMSHKLTPDTSAERPGEDLAPFSESCFLLNLCALVPTHSYL